MTSGTIYETWNGPTEPRKQLPWNHWHLLAPREPQIECCSHGRPEHQAMIRQLAEAMGYDLPAIAATPAQVWAGLLDEIERRFR